MQTLIASPQDFAAISRQTPDKIALSLVTLSGAERWSYAKLLAETEALAQEMRAAGNGPITLEPVQALLTPVRLAAALQAGLQVQAAAPLCAGDGAALGPNLPLAPSDRIFLAGKLDDPAVLRAIMAAWGMGATVLCASPKLTPAQLPLLMRRHDVSLIAGRAEALADLLAANLTPLPKLRASFALDAADEALQEAWLARMGLALGQA